MVRASRFVDCVQTIWKRFWRLSRTGAFEAFFQALAGLSRTAHLVQMFDSTAVRAHVSSAGAKGGQDGQALGRSRGGFSTKIHLKTDFEGLPLDFHLTSGEASDSRQFETLLGIGPDIRPRAVMTDKGCGAKANREAARRRGICPVPALPEQCHGSPSILPQAALPPPRPERAGHRQAQALQARGPPLREDGRELRRHRRLRLRPDLGQIRPHGLKWAV
jgi:transposase